MTSRLLIYLKQSKQRYEPYYIVIPGLIDHPGKKWTIFEIFLPSVHKIDQINKLVKLHRKIAESTKIPYRAANLILVIYQTGNVNKSLSTKRGITEC